MNVHEIKFLAPAGMEAGEVENAVGRAAEQADGPVEVLSATIHARYPEKPVVRNHEAAVVVITNSQTHLYELMGAVARLTGMPALNEVELGTDSDASLSFKASEETLAEFVDTHAERLGIEQTAASENESENESESE